MRDIALVSKPLFAIPYDLAADAVPAVIDRKDWDSVMFVRVLQAGAYTSANYLTPSLKESDDGETFTDVDADKITGDSMDPVKATVAAAEIFAYSYIGNKRYLKFSDTLTGELATTYVEAFAILQNRRNKE